MTKMSLLFYCLMFIVLLKSSNSFKSRSLDGTPISSISNYPYVVSIFDDRKQVCGGVIVAKSWVLTAAHCLCKSGTNIAINKSRLNIGVGTFDLDNILPENLFSVKEIIIHEDYDNTQMINDIALILLKRQIKISHNVNLVYLPSKKLFEDGFLEPFRKFQFCEVLLWGKKDYSSNTRQLLLRRFMIPLISEKKCRKYLYNRIISNKQLCSLYNVAGDEVCKDDSGGPLMCDQILVGIISWGKDCKIRKNPGVYTRVDTYLDWITKTSSKSNIFKISFFLSFVMCIIYSLL